MRTSSLLLLYANILIAANLRSACLQKPREKIKIMQLTPIFPDPPLPEDIHGQILVCIEFLSCRLYAVLSISVSISDLSL
jgi:hypothetical protein